MAIVWELMTSIKWAVRLAHLQHPRISPPTNQRQDFHQADSSAHQEIREILAAYFTYAKDYEGNKVRPPSRFTCAVVFDAASGVTHGRKGGRISHIISNGRIYQKVIRS